ncbi:MAG: YggN family protein [Pseudomonadota bacterium]|nr:YggN family protein [Pseudomonadota bacterium]
MRRLIVTSVLLIACGTSLAADLHCEVHSDYDLSLNERSVIFTRDDGSPKAIVMRQGRLFVDDRWLELTPADARRVAQFERGARQAMPEAHAVGVEAANIAFLALSEVATGLSSDPAATRARLAKAKGQLDATLARSVTPTRFDSQGLGDGVSAAVREVLPTLIGDIVGGAVSAALSGDTSRLERMETMDARIEAQVDARAGALQKRGEALCQQLAALDELDDALELRVDGKPLDLLEATAQPSRK